MHTQQRRVMVIAQDPSGSIQPKDAALEDALQTRYQVTRVTEAQRAVALASESRYDALILNSDVTLIQTFQACEQLRRHEATRQIPLIVVSKSDDSERRALLLSVGADDCVTLTISNAELLARVDIKARWLQAALEPRPPERSERVTCGDISLDLRRLEVWVGTRRVDLSVLEFNLLKYFVENCDRVLDRRKILHAVWRDAVVTDRTVDTHIASLRRKLGQAEYSISTVYGAGYSLKPHVAVPEALPQAVVPPMSDAVFGSFATTFPEAPHKVD